MPHSQTVAFCGQAKYFAKPVISLRSGSSSLVKVFSRLLLGAEVRIDCKFKAIPPRMIEEIKFSSNRTTDKFRAYKLEVPSIDGIECTREKVIESSCKASLMWSASSSCNVPGYRTMSVEIVVKSRQGNLCI
ncbi:hypothetical protein Vadar_034132 [Vaccinium darrowii]|uniref:Uncharacterized protein n=1 Tax=Vaccinium darrowii TaxID=229202 RepID=A0ACB7Z0K1_9ERIC|nr:hypothetical protein Vadar_034132 [Vaccinium darrowii]